MIIGTFYIPVALLYMIKVHTGTGKCMHCEKLYSFNMHLFVVVKFVKTML